MTLFIIPIMYDILFKRQPRNVDIGGDNLDDVPDDAAEFIAQALAEQTEQEIAEATVQIAEESSAE
jgi:hypothetical protein